MHGALKYQGRNRCVIPTGSLPVLPPALHGVICASEPKERKLLQALMGTFNRWAVLAIILVVGGAAIGILAWANQARAEPNDWPPLIMRYNVEAAVSGRSIGEVRQLTYNSRTSWIEEVIEADDITVRVGTFNAVGSYQKLDGRVNTEYAAITGRTMTETVPKGVVRIPRGGMRPVPIAVLESALGKQAEKVATTTKVCFDDDCTEPASGWELSDGKSTLVFADDARGIPIRIGNFVVTEVLVRGAQQPVVRKAHDSD